MTYSVEESNSAIEQTRKRTVTQLYVGTPIAAISPAIFLALVKDSSANPIDWATALSLGAFFGFLVAALFVSVTVLLGDDSKNRAGGYACLPTHVSALIGRIEKSFVNIMELQPPPNTLEEILAHRTAFESSVDELITIQSNVGPEDLTSSSAYKWIKELEYEISSVESDLRSVRLESYTVPRPAPNLALTKKSVAEEKAVVRDVLARTDDEPFTYLLETERH